jgi:single-stranded DNA-binding protein
MSDKNHTPNKIEGGDKRSREISGVIVNKDAQMPPRGSQSEKEKKESPKRKKDRENKENNRKQDNINDDNGYN